MYFLFLFLLRLPACLRCFIKFDIFVINCLTESTIFDPHSYFKIEKNVLKIQQIGATNPFDIDSRGLFVDDNLKKTTTTRVHVRCVHVSPKCLENLKQIRSNRRASHLRQLHVVQTFKMPMNEFEEARSSHSFQSLAAIARQSDLHRRAPSATREGSQQGVSQSRASSTQFSLGAASPSASSAAVVVNPPSTSPQKHQHIPLSTIKINQSASNSQNISNATATTTAIPIEIEA